MTTTTFTRGASVQGRPVFQRAIRAIADFLEAVYEGYAEGKRLKSAAERTYPHLNFDA
jgi:hypothetical protein